MRLNTKVSLLFFGIATTLIAILVAISLYAFYTFSITSSQEHIRTSAEIVRVHLTEAMINGVIDQRESFLRRLMEVEGLESARVVRSDLVVNQFGEGLANEMQKDDIEKKVLNSGLADYEVIESSTDTLIRGTIPFIATDAGEPNCLQCHEVQKGQVLGAVTVWLSIGNLKQKAIMTVAGIAATVTVFFVIAFVAMRRMICPVSVAANHVEEAVHKALDGDFTTQVDQTTNDEVGRIAKDVNRLLAYLDDGLSRIAENVTRLTSRAPRDEENKLEATIEMVNGLTRAAHFKQAIEEDETKDEIHRRLVNTLQDEYKIGLFSLYESLPNKRQMVPLFIDGEQDVDCRWCDSQILVRSDACRAKRTGHLVDGVLNPGICYSFDPPEQFADYRHICLPIMQSGAVGNVLQLISPPGSENDLHATLPYITVYLREAAPVLETKKLMETLRESTLRDPMTGLNNRRFLEEYVDTLVANVQRRQTRLAILMLDLDFFKMVNDTYGHDAGDTVIKELAKVLRQSVRSADMVIRYGGEEFMIILVDTPPNDADMVAEKIRASVEAMEIHAGNVTLKKTISIGLSDFPSDSDTFWQAVKFADVALYQAKETGRNKTVRFNPEMWGDNKTY